MRRTLFGKFQGLEQVAPVRVSPAEALLFDISDQRSSRDHSLAEQRVASWAFVPWLLLAGKLVIGIGLLLQERVNAGWTGLAAVGIPLGLSLATDVTAGLMLLYWRRLQMAPHTVARLMCAYFAVTGTFGTLAVAAADGLGLTSESFLALALGSGFFIRAVASIGSPPLAVINAVIVTSGSAAPCVGALCQPITSPSAVTTPAAVVVPPISTPRINRLMRCRLPSTWGYRLPKWQSSMPRLAAAARAAGVPRPTISVSRCRP